MCVAEWSWASKSKPFVCSDLKPVSQKNWQEEMKFTFDVAKCDRIFDYLLQEKQIKLPNGHVIPSPEELKRSAYCKWHNSHSYATNDCNVFRRQVQSAINEGRLRFAESPKMQLDSNPFPVNVIDFENSKVLVRPSQAESTKNKAVIVSDGGMHTVKTPSSGSGQSSLPRMIKPRSPEIGRWKVNESRNKATKRVEKPKPTFKDLLAKYEGRAGQIILKDQDHLQCKGLRVRIVDGRISMHHRHIFLLGHRCRYHGVLVLLVFLLVHHGVGVVHGCLLLQ